MNHMTELRLRVAGLQRKAEVAAKQCIVESAAEWARARVSAFSEALREIDGAIATVHESAAPQGETPNTDSQGTTA